MNELNKIAGGVLGALLAFLLIGFFSSKLYGTRPGAHEGEQVLAFAVEVEEDGGGEGGGDAGPDWSTLLAEVDASNGESAFNKCKSCHAVEDGNNGVGPHLYGVVGREIANVSGYSYSGALSDKDGSWDLENLFGFLHDPKGWAPGTKMGYNGLKNDQDKVDLIAWLNEQGPSPIELAAPEGSGGGDHGGGEGSGEEDGAEGGESAEAEGGDAGGSGGSMFADADAEAGSKVFNKCKACHAFGKNGVGPDLQGIVGREIASVDGYGYSDALAGKDGSWDPQTLSAFLEDPKGWAKGTKMSYAGLKKEEDRANVIAYLNEQSDDPIDLGGSGGGGSESGDDAAAEEGGSGGGDEAASDEEATEETGAEGGGEEEASAEGGDQGGGEEEASAEGGDQGGGEATSEEEASAEGGDQAGDEAASEEEASAEGGDQSGDGDGQQMAAAESEGSGEAAASSGGDAAAGEKVFRKCKACHAFGKNGVGPDMSGVVGREIASLDGFNYSDALKGKDGSWDAETLSAFLENPRGWAKGTKMSFGGLKKEEDRANVIEYLKQEGGN